MWIISKPLEWFYNISSIALDIGHVARFKSDTALMTEYAEMLSDKELKELDEFKNSIV